MGDREKDILEIKLKEIHNLIDSRNNAGALRQLGQLIENVKHNQI